MFLLSDSFLSFSEDYLDVRRLSAVLCGRHCGHLVPHSLSCSHPWQQQHFCVPGDMLARGVIVCDERQGDQTCSLSLLAKLTPWPVLLSCRNIISMFSRTHLADLLFSCCPGPRHCLEAHISGPESIPVRRDLFLHSGEFFHLCVWDRGHVCVSLSRNATQCPGW